MDTIEDFAVLGALLLFGRERCIIQFHSRLIDELIAAEAGTPPCRPLSDAITAKESSFFEVRQGPTPSSSPDMPSSQGIARLSFVGRHLALSTDVGFRRFDVARMSQTTMNIAAITGPSTMPFSCL